MPKHTSCLILTIVLLTWVVDSSGAYKLTQENVFQNSVSLLNAFSRCTIRVINFPGYNINVTKLMHPLLLLRYFSFDNTNVIFPFEISHFNSTQRLQFYNQEMDIQYANSPYTYKLKNSNRNCKCETEIIIEPPTKKSQKLTKMWITSRPI